jgi:DNA-binding MurR/RpiR family transcriptional regulator
MYEIAKEQKAKTICITNFYFAHRQDFGLSSHNQCADTVFHDDSVITRICEMAVIDTLFFLLADLRHS